MPSAWTGEVVGRMHVNQITNKMLADALGVTDRYVSMVLNGHKAPGGAEEKFNAALDSLIANRTIPAE